MDQEGNNASLEAFLQQQDEIPIPRNKRRSSILKMLDSNLDQDRERRISRRISFHNNILCQQILPDGTTQIVTEALKAKLPDSSVSTVSTDQESRMSTVSAPETAPSSPSRKRSSIGSSSNESVGKKVRKDPKIIAQSYQNFIKKTYNVNNENDYETVYNTSVNRNGFQVIPRESRLDITKLFAVDTDEADMEITRLTTSTEAMFPDEQTPIKRPTEEEETRVFDSSEGGMSLEDSWGSGANVTEMDTAMILDDLEFSQDNSVQQQTQEKHESENQDDKADEGDKSNDPDVSSDVFESTLQDKTVADEEEEEVLLSLVLDPTQDPTEEQIVDEEEIEIETVQEHTSVILPDMVNEDKTEEQEVAKETESESVDKENKEEEKIEEQEEAAKEIELESEDKEEEKIEEQENVAEETGLESVDKEDANEDEGEDEEEEEEEELSEESSSSSSQESITEVSMIDVTGDIQEEDKTKLLGDDASEGLMEITEPLDVSMKSIIADEEETNIFDSSKTEAVMQVDSKLEEEEEFPTSSQGTTVSSQPMELTNVVSVPVVAVPEVKKEKMGPEVIKEKLYNAVSRLSWPRSTLDAAISLRRKQIRQTMHSFVDDSSVSSIESCYSTPTTTSIASRPASSARKRFSLSRSRLSIEMRASPVFQVSKVATPKSINTTRSIMNCTSKESKSPMPVERSINISRPTLKERLEILEQNQLQETCTPTVSNDIRSSTSSGSSSSDFLASSDPSTQTTPSKKSMSETTQILTTTNFDTTMASDDSESSLEQYDKSYRLPDTEDDDQDDTGRPLHEDSMFEVMKENESSFCFSPNTSFHSSFVCMDDTLVVMAEDLDLKLNDCSILNETVRPPSESRGPVEDPTFIPLKRFDQDAWGAKFVKKEADNISVLFVYGSVVVNIELGTTLRSFNGIPIKIIKKIEVESRLKSMDDPLTSIIDPYLSWDFFLKIKEEHKVFFRAALDGMVASFEDMKNHLLSKYSTTDKLPDLLKEIAILANRSRDFLKDILWTNNFYPAKLYSKGSNDGVYEFAFELPGRFRNFFLLLPIDSKAYPFSPVRCRFGFDPQDKSLYNVKNFARALCLAVKPGPTYINRMIRGAKEYVVISRKIRFNKK